MSQKERLVALLTEMGVGFSDTPCGPGFVQEKIDENRCRYGRAEVARKLQECLSATAGRLWSLVVIDQGYGYRGFFCEFLFGPDGNAMNYGCWQ